MDRFSRFPEEDLQSEPEPYSGGSSDDYVIEDRADDSSSSESDLEGRKKNRKAVNNAQWKRNKRKRLLATGKRHVNTANKIVGPRVVGEDCRCKFKCFEKCDEQQRTQVLRQFNAIGEKIRQDTYLSGLISSLEIKRNGL